MGYEKEFNAIKNGTLLGLELHNFIGKVTEGKPEKLELLRQDLTAEYEKQLRLKEKQFSIAEIKAAVRKLDEQNQNIYKQLAHKPFKLHRLKSNSKPLQVLPDDLILGSLKRYLRFADEIFGDYDNQPLDIEKLLFPDEFIRVRNLIYALEQLIKLASDDVRNNKVNIRNNIHKVYYPWIERTFNEQYPKLPSQNKTVQKVQELYFEKFGLKIGKTTVLRAAKKAT